MESVRCTVEGIQRGLYIFLAPGQVCELRALGTRMGTQSGYFNDFDKMAEAAGKLNGQCNAIYFTPNPVNPGLLARANNRVSEYIKSGDATKDSDKVRRQSLLIDFDSVRPAGISSTHEEHEVAIARSRECKDYSSSLGWPDSVLCDSGNGAYLIYRIDLSNNDDSCNLTEECLKALAYHFDDEAVTVDPTTYNASRIWKMYGTLVR